MRRAYWEFPAHIRVIAADRVAVAPLVSSSVKSWRRGGVCLGTTEGHPCLFSRRHPGEPVKNTGLRCIWCRPNLEQALRVNASRQKLRGAFAKLTATYQSVLLDRLPAYERPNWRVAESAAESSAAGRGALSDDIREFTTGTESSPDA